MTSDSPDGERSLTDIFIAGQLPDLPFPSNVPTTDLIELAKILNLYHGECIVTTCVHGCQRSSKLKSIRQQRLQEDRN